MEKKGNELVWTYVGTKALIWVWAAIQQLKEWKTLCCIYKANEQEKKVSATALKFKAGHWLKNTLSGKILGQKIINPSISHLMLSLPLWLLKES